MLNSCTVAIIDTFRSNASSPSQIEFHLANLKYEVDFSV